MCMQVKECQLEPDMEQGLDQNWERSMTRLYIVIFVQLYVEYIMQNVGLNESQAGIKISGRKTNNLRCVDDTTLMTER